MADRPFEKLTDDELVERLVDAARQEGVPAPSALGGFAVAPVGRGDEVEELARELKERLGERLSLDGLDGAEREGVRHFVRELAGSHQRTAERAATAR